MAPDDYWRECYPIEEVGFSYLIPDANQLIGFRNRLVHNYETLDYGAVWAFIQHDFPALKEIADGYMQNNPPTGSKLNPEDPELD